MSFAAEYLRQGTPARSLRWKNASSSRVKCFAAAVHTSRALLDWVTFFVLVILCGCNSAGCARGLCPGGFVVSDLLMRHQQGSNGVDIGFAEPMSPVSNALSLIRVDRPYMSVEGAPIEYFQAPQAVPLRVCYRYWFPVRVA